MTHEETAQVIGIIQQSLSSDSSKRQAAERQLSSLQATRPDFCLHLLQVAVSPSSQSGAASSSSIEVSQMAAFALKTLVDSQWSSHSLLSAPIRDQLRQALLHSLATVQESKIQSALAFVISRIASFDWPEQWPGLFDSLLDMVKSQQVVMVAGSLACLGDFIQSEMTDMQFPHIARALIPELFKVFGSSEFGADVRARCLGILCDCMEMLETLREEYPDEAAALFDSFVRPWLPAMLAVVSADSDDTRLAVAVCKVVAMLLDSFGSVVREELREFIHPCFRAFLSLAGVYMRRSLSSSGGDVGFIAVGDDPLEADLYVVFELMSSLSGVKSYREVFTREISGSSMLSQLLQVSVQCAQITSAQEEEWEDEPNLFALEEDDDIAVNVTVRSSSCDLVSSLSSAFKIDGLNCLLKLLSEMVQKVQSCPNEAASWWKPLEATLFIIGEISYLFIDAVENQKIAFDIVSLFNNVIQHLLALREHPYIRARSLTFAGKFASMLPSQLLAKFCEAAIIAFRNDEETAAVRICAMTAVQKFCRVDNADLLAQMQLPIVDGALSLLPRTIEDTLTSVLETLEFAVNINIAPLVPLADTLGSCLIDVWSKNIADRIIESLVLDIFNALAANPQILERFYLCQMPSLCKVVTDNERPLAESAEIRASALDLISIFVKNSSREFDGLQNVCFSLTSLSADPKFDETELMASSQKFWKNVVEKFGHSLAQWKFGNQTGLDMLLQIISKYLQPSPSNEDGAQFAGAIVAKLMICSVESVRPILPQLLQALVVRLKPCKMAASIQSIITAISHFIVMEPSAVVDLLASLQVDNISGLQLLLNMWTDNWDYFNGYFALKVNIVALSKLVTCGSEKLSQIIVKGDKIEDPKEAGLIMTRSRRKSAVERFEMIPFPQRCFKMLLAQYSEDLEVRRVTDTPDMRAIDGDDDDDWEEDEQSGDAAFQYINDIVSNDGDFEDDDDEGTMANPLYGQDMRLFIKELFRTLYSQQPEALRSFAAQTDINSRRLLESLLI